MPKILRVRELTAEEQASVARLSHSRTAAASQVERAKIIQALAQGKSVPEVAQALQVKERKVRQWLKRFNEHGREGLQERERSGRPATYSPEQISELVAISLTKPDALGQPFGHWTLDRLETYLNEERGIAIKRSRINEILLAEGLRWRKEEHWFGERVDPDFAKKRGSLPPSTPSHPQAVSS
jgi:transposase